ncbi:glycosyltransferase family 4 protein [candidate division KSB1 bacterium]|nr:glycosyltransferase family 4 protein [candidate division KSB1 bacterium]
MNTSSFKKVLIVTYYFPPSGGAGVQRVLKFVKYLPEFGWQPVILAPLNADYPAYDETLTREIPNTIKIFRSKILEPYKFYRKLTGKEACEAMDIATLSRDGKQHRKATERISEFIRSNFFIPDARIGWYPFAVRAGQQAIRDEQIDVVLSSAPPYTCHLIGKALKKSSKLPWICDFRDSWVGWLSAAQRRGLAYKIECRMEHSVLSQADRILTVSPGVQDDLLSRNQDLRDNRWIHLPNGYDSEDFSGLEPIPQKSPEKLTITYSGSLYGNRNPDGLLKALKDLIEADPSWRQVLQLIFVGRVGKPIQEQLNHEKFTGMIKLIPYVTHSESIRYLLASDLLLLIIDDAPANKGILTGKLYEYLGARKPILALAPEGNAVDLIRELNAGFIAPPKDAARIKDTLIQIRKMWLGGQLNQKRFHEEKIHALDRKSLTGQLATILNDLSHAK